MGGVGFNPPQRSLGQRTGSISQEMLQSWASKLGAGAQVVLTSDQTVAITTITAIDWDSAPQDTHGFWTSTAPSRLTIPKGLDGVYLAGGQMRWESSTSGTRQQRINLTSTSGIEAGGVEVTLWPVSTVTATAVIWPFPTRRMYMAAGDYIEAEAYRTGVGVVDVEAASADTLMWLTRVGDLPREARIGL